MKKSEILAAGVEITVPVIDKTGSMSATDFPPTRLECAKEAALEFIRRKRLLDVRDRTAVVAFEREARLVSVFGRHPYEAQGDVLGLAASGGTNITAGLRLALELILGEAKGQREPTLRCILLSDGQHNTGPSPVDDGVLNRMRKTGVIVDTVAIGPSGEHLLRAIAAQTGGTFARCRDFPALLARYRGLAAKKRLPSA